MATTLDSCTVDGCTVTAEHHHLAETDFRADVCDGGSDEYDRQKICCELGPRYRAVGSPVAGAEA